jgi:hypothetical protein
MVKISNFNDTRMEKLLQPNVPPPTELDEVINELWRGALNKAKNLLHPLLQNKQTSLTHSYQPNGVFWALHQ